MSARRRALLALPLAVLARAVLAQSPPKPIEFRSQVAAVYVDVFVTRGGKPVPDLRASDFALRDNGVPQQLELLSAESRPLKAVLVFDTSSSMAGDRIEALRAAGEAFLDGLRPADEAGLVAFSEDVLLARRPDLRQGGGAPRALPAAGRRRHLGLRRALRGDHALGGRAAAADRAVHRRRGQHELARRRRT